MSRVLPLALLACLWCVGTADARLVAEAVNPDGTLQQIVPPSRVVRVACVLADGLSVVGEVFSSSLWEVNES